MNKKKICIKGSIIAVILCVIAAFSIIDLANLIVTDESLWNNKVLFIAQVTLVIIVFSLYGFIKTKVYKEVEQ